MREADAAHPQYRVLALAPTRRDAELTRTIFAEAGAECTLCPDMAAVCAEMERGAAAVLLTEEAAADGNADALIDCLRRQPPWSDLPVLVLMRGGAASQPPEAFEGLGNVSLLERPIRVANLVSAVRTAQRARRRQYELRDLLAERERTNGELRRSQDFLRQSEARAAAELEGMRRLHATSIRLLKAPDLKAAMTDVLGAAMALMNADFGSVQRYDPATGALHLIGQRNFGDGFEDAFSVVRNGDATTCARAMRLRKRVLLEDVRTDAELAPQAAAFEAWGFRAAQSSPLLNARGELLGMLSTHFAQPHRPAERELRILDLHVRQAADFLERLGSEEALREREGRLRRKNQWLGLLGESAASLLTADDPGRLVRDLFDKVSGPLGAELYFHFVVNDSGTALKLESCGGVTEEAARAFSNLEFGQAVCGTAAREGRRIVVSDVQNCGYDKAAGVRGMGVRAYACQPLMVGRRMIGTLSFGSRSKDRFADDELEFMATLSHYVAAAKDRLRLTAEARRQAQAAEAANRLKDQFLATLSHELRTPLNAIVGWVHMLRMGLGDEQEVRNGLDVIERNAKAQTTLINDLLDVSRIISGKLMLRSEAVDPAAVVRAAMDSTALAARAKDIGIAVDADADLPRVIGDVDRLQQCVWNLLSNAVKFTPAGGRVNVSLRRDGSSVVIAVADNGPGIDPEFLPHLFERFRQADALTTRRHGGLGLGLAIVRHLVEMHGGTVRAESDGVGKGSRFVLTLPVRAIIPIVPSVEDLKAAGPAPEPAPRRRLDGQRVLIVDDQPDARELLLFVMRKYGAEAAAAASALEALEAMQHFRPTVLVSDIGMPEMDGYALIREIRGLSPDRGGKTPAVALTAFARTEERDLALAAGFQLHVAKPVEPAVLADAVAALGGRLAG